MRGRMKDMTGLLFYVILSASGLTIIKIGVNKGATLTLGKTGFSMELNWLLILGMALYIISFLTSMVVMKGMNLSLFYPISAGLIYIFICALSVTVLKEHITAKQLIGMAIILAGIIIMNLEKNV